MAIDAKWATDKLEVLKGYVKESNEYFQENNEHFSQSMRFIFDSTLTSYDKEMLQVLERPPLEFNVIAPYLSRLLGEWSKQNPGVSVNSANDPMTYSQQDLQQINTTIEVVQGHIKHILSDSNKSSIGNEILKETLGGGHSVIKLMTEYENDRSFDQVFKIDKSFDPTMVVFDPLDHTVTKHKGRYFGEIYPMTREDFEKEYPSENVDDLKFYAGVSGFTWSYKNNDKDVLLIADLYEKEKKRVKLHKLSNGKVMTEKEYEEFIEKWEEEKHIEQIPCVVDSRTTVTDTIVRYIFMGDRILKKEVTQWPGFPLVFVDGNSAYVKKEGDNNATQQVTQSYFKNAVDAQKLKNWVGQSLATELEEIVQSKWTVAVDSIPEDAEDTYTNPQRNSVLLYNARDREGRDLPPPQRVARGDIPPALSQSFNQLDQTIQNIISTFDASMGKNESGASGVSIVNSATNNNSVAMPYIMGYMAALNRIADLMIQMMPLYYKTPRSIPVMNSQGQKSFMSVNQTDNAGNPLPNSINMQYDPNLLKVEVKADYNFEIQKDRSLATITTLMQASPGFAQMMNGPGLPILVQNLNIQGTEELLQLVNNSQEQQQQAANQPQQMDPQTMLAQQQVANSQQELQLRQQQLQANNQKMQADSAYKSAQMQLAQEKLANERLKMAYDAGVQSSNNDIQITKANTEKEAKAADLAMKAMDQTHQHAKDYIKPNPQFKGVNSNDDQR